MTQKSKSETPDAFVKLVNKALRCGAPAPRLADMAQQYTCGGTVRWSLKNLEIRLYQMLTESRARQGAHLALFLML